MTLYKKIQSTFTGGEISPRLLARTDLDIYNEAVKEMRNMYPLTHGGATRRPGTTYIGAVSDPEKPVRLLRFVYSRTDSYLLVFNNGVMEVIKEKEFILSGASHYQLAMPYSDDELSEFTYAQTGNVMIICHPNHYPKVLRRNDEDDWEIEDIDFIYNAVSDYPYVNNYITFQILSAGDDENGHVVGTTYTIVVHANGTYTASGPTGSPTPLGEITAVEVNQDDIVAQTWVITCTFSGEDREEWSVVGTGIASPATESLGTPIAQWNETNYPKAVSFYEQRLFFAGSTIWPQRVWGSGLGDFFNLTLGPLASDGVDFQIASNSYDQIIHLESTRQLLPMSFASEFSISGPQGATVTSSAVSVRVHTFHGTSDVRPIRIGQEVLFVQRDGKKVRSLRYDIALDSNIAPDLTILAEHITGDGISDMTFAQEPDAIAWLIREDGALLSLTHLRDMEVTGWAAHSTDGSFINVCCLPEGQVDTVYLCVERTVNQIPVKYIEYLTPDIYLDSSVVLEDFTATDTITGLDHLEGLEVSIVADDRVHASRTVDNGEITLEREVESVVIGLPYVSHLTLLHPDVELADGTSQGRQLRIVSLILRLQDTVGVKVNDTQVPGMEFSIMLDTPIEPFTGDKKIFVSGWDYPNNVVIEQPDPMPLTVLGAIYKLEIND